MSVLEGRRAAVREALHAALAAAIAEGQLPAVEVPPQATVSEPRDRTHGDLSANLAMLLAGPARMPGRDVAGILVRHLDVSRVPGCLRAEVAGPGFLNFFLQAGWLSPVVEEVLSAGAAYGCSDHGRGQRVLVEFVSANPTGPLNVVNCRAAAFGDALVRCLRAVGYRVEAEYFVNDAGGQVRKLGMSLEVRLRQLRGESVGMPDGGYPGAYLVEVARAYADTHGNAVLDAPEDARVSALARYAVERLLAEQRAVLERFRVSFDHFVREAAIRETGAPERVVEHLVELGRTEERDGALWLCTKDSKEDNDNRVLRKRDGSLTYRVPDIAYHAAKFERGYDRLIDIYGQDHHGEVPAVRLALQWLGYPVERLEVLLTQMVRLVRDGRDAGKVSKRGGTFIAMTDFLDDVGVDPARYFFLMRTIDTHMDFDVDLARSRTQDNPVYYVQYAHARICSIMRQAAGVEIPDMPLAVLDHPAEASLCYCLAMYPEEVRAAAESRAPHRLTAYLRTTAERFHTFYVQCRVIGEEPPRVAARMALCRATRQVLASALGLLGVSAPERM